MRGCGCLRTGEHCLWTLCSDVSLPWAVVRWGTSRSGQGQELHRHAGALLACSPEDHVAADTQGARLACSARGRHRLGARRVSLAVLGPAGTRQTSRVPDGPKVQREAVSRELLEHCFTGLSSPRGTRYAAAISFTVSLVPPFSTGGTGVTASRLKPGLWRVTAKSASMTGSRGPAGCPGGRGRLVWPCPAKEPVFHWPWVWMGSNEA